MEHTDKHYGSTQTVENDSPKLLQCSESGQTKPGSFSGWEWLRTPAVLLVLVGATGLLRGYYEDGTAWLSWLKFPPLWACYVVIVGGVILGAISAAGYYTQHCHSILVRPRKGWRSL
jgi:hypothetical protein